jgi:hypothetical protein
MRCNHAPLKGLAENTALGDYVKVGAPAGQVPVACFLQQVVCHLAMPVQRSIVQAPAIATQATHNSVSQLERHAPASTQHSRVGGKLTLIYSRSSAEYE